jgi:plastocyanin
MNVLSRATRLRLSRISVVMPLLAAAAFGLSPFMATTAASAADNELTITIKDHKFEPANPEIPAGTRIKLTVVNADPTAEEFESHDFHVEKIVGAGKTISVYIGPLDAGTYKFFGERHEDTAQGVLTAK